MKIEDIITKLNWFYNLELSQVDLYTSQSEYFKDTYPSQVFERISYIEQQHVDNIAEKIKDLGGKPSFLGDIIAPIIGSIGGKVVAFTGLEDTLKINILLEEKAKKDYKEFIHIVKTENRDKELLNLLESNYIDEDLHTAWFNNHLSKL